MSLATRIESLVIRVAQEFNDVRAKAGNLANLTTTDKSNLVAAINELQAAVVSSTVIDDAQIATTSTYSSNKIVSLLDALKTEILGGADAAYDTLVEIQQLLQNRDYPAPVIELLGEHFCTAFQMIKDHELSNFEGVISSWERDHLLLKV